MMYDDYTTRVGRARLDMVNADLYDLPYEERPDDGRILVHVGDLTPVCADCGRGHLQWAEAGYVPWHRICDTCGSHWDLHPLGMGIGYLPQEPTCGRERMIETPCADCGGRTEGDWCERCDGTGVDRRPDPARTCYHADPYRCAEHAAAAGYRDEIDAVAAGVDGRLRCACVCHVPPFERPIVGRAPHVWIDGTGWVPVDPTWAITRPLLPLRALARTGRLSLRAILAADNGPDIGAAATEPTWGDLLARVTPDHIAAAEREQARTLGVPCVPACWARRARFV